MPHLGVLRASAQQNRVQPQRIGDAKDGPRLVDLSTSPSPLTWAGHDLLYGDRVDVLETKASAPGGTQKGG